MLRLLDAGVPNIGRNFYPLQSHLVPRLRIEGMADIDDEEAARRAKVLAAKKKLKKFQSKREVGSPQLGITNEHRRRDSTTSSVVSDTTNTNTNQSAGLVGSESSHKLENGKRRSSEDIGPIDPTGNQHEESQSHDHIQTAAPNQVNGGLDSYQTKISELVTMNEKLQKQKEEAERLHAEKDSLLASNVAALAGIRTDNTRLEDALASAPAQAQLQEAGSQLATTKSEDEYILLKSKCDNLQNEKQSLETKVQRLQETVNKQASNQSRVAGPQSELLARANAAKTDLERKLVQAQAQLQRTNTQLKATEGRMRNELEAAKKKIEEQQRAQQEHLPSEYESLQLKVKASEDERQRLSEKLKALETESEQIKADSQFTAQSHDGNLAEVNSSNESLKARLAEAEQYLQKLQSASQTEMEKLLEEQRAKQEALQKELEQAQKQLQEIQKENQTRENELLEAHNAKERGLYTELDQSRSELEVHTSQNQLDLKKLLDEHEAKEQNLRVQLEQSRRELQALQTESQSGMQKLLEEQQAKERDLQKELQNINKQLENHQLESQQATKRLIEEQQAKQNLEHKLQQTQKDLANQQAESKRDHEHHTAIMTEMKASYESSQQAVSSKEAELEKLQKHIESVLSQCDKLSTELTNTQAIAKQVPGIEMQISELLKKEEEVKKQLTAEKELTEKLQITVERLNEDLASGKMDHDTKIRDLTHAHSLEISKWTENDATLKSRLSEVEEVVVTLRQTIDEQTDSMTKKEQSSAMLQQDLITAKATIEASKAEKTELENILSALRSEHQSIVEEKNELAVNLDDHSKNITMLSDSNKQLSSKLENAVKSLEDYRLETSQQHKITLDSYKAALETSNRNALEMERKLQAQLEELTANLQAMTERKSLADKHIIDRESDIKKQKDQHDAASESLNAEIAKLTAELESITTELERRRVEQEQQLEQLQQLLDQEQATNKQSVQRLQALQDEFQRATVAAEQDAKTKGNNIQELLSAIKEHEVDASNRVKQLEAAHEQLKSLKEEHIVTLADLQKSVTEKNDTQHELSRQLTIKAHFEEQTTTMAQQIAELEQAISASEEAKKAIELEMSEMHQSHENEISDIYQSHEQAMNAITIDLEQSSSHVSSMEKARKELEAKFMNHKTETAKQVEELHWELEDMNRLKHKLTEDLQDLQSQLHTSQSEAAELDEKLSEALASKQELEADLRAQIAENHEIATKNMESVSMELEKMTGQHSSVTERLKVAEAMIALERNKLQEKQAEHEKLMLEERSKQSNLVAELDNSREGHQQVVDELKRTCNENERQLSSLEEKIEQQNASMKDLKSNYSDVQLKFENLHREHKTLNDKHLNVTSRLDAEISGREQDNKAHTEASNSERAVFAQEKATLEQAMQRFQADLDEAKSTYNQAVSGYEDRISQLTSEKISVASNLEATQAKMTVLSAEHAKSLESLCSELEDSKERMRTDGERHTELQNLQDEQISQLHNQLTEQTERITQLEAEIEVARRSLKDAESSFVQAQLDTKSEMETMTLTYNKTIQHLESQICEQKEAFELDLQQQKDLLANAKNEIESLTQLLSESNSISDAYSKDLSKQQSKIQELELKIVNLDQYCSQKDHELQELEADRDEKMKELESLGFELSGLRSEIAATGENHSQANHQLTVALQEKGNALTKIKQHHEATKGAYENKLIDAQNTCKELEGKAGFLESELSQSKRNWELNDQQSKQSVQKLDAIIAEQRKTIVELQRHLEQANTQASKYQTDYEHTHSARDELSQTVNEHATSLTRCRKDLNSLQEQVSSLESDLEAANNELSQTKNKLLLLSKEREERENSFNNDLEATLSALNIARSEIADLTGQTLKAPQTDAAQEAAANVQKASSKEDHKIVIQRLQAQIEESERRLSRQLDAFNTIRGELTTVRERQLDREDEIEQRMQAQIDELQESLNEAYEKRRMAEGKLQQAGLSPVSERGFWVSDDGMSDSEGSEGIEDGSLAKELVDPHRSPVLGRIPPLQKPRFSEFHHVPQCSGCLSEAFDV